jgi:hypothetical protein
MDDLGHLKRDSESRPAGAGPAKRPIPGPGPRGRPTVRSLKLLSHCSGSGRAELQRHRLAASREPRRQAECQRHRHTGPLAFLRLQA